MQVLSSFLPSRGRALASKANSGLQGAPGLPERSEGGAALPRGAVEPLRSGASPALTQAAAAPGFPRHAGGNAALPRAVGPRNDEGGLSAAAGLPESAAEPGFPRWARAVTTTATPRQPTGPARSHRSQDNGSVDAGDSRRSEGGGDAARGRVGLKATVLIFTLAAAAVAAENGNWIEQAGGTATRDAAGKVVAVDLRSSWVTDSDMPRLAQLPDLKKLDLSLTRISDRGMRALKSAPAIEELNLYFAERITDEGTAVVKSWKHLKRVNFRGTKMTDVTLEYLGGVPTLEAIDAGYAETTDVGWEYLTSLTNLKSLTLGGNKLTDTSLQFLRTMPQIEYLDISGTQRTDSGLWSLGLSIAGARAIATVKELRELRLAGTAINTQGLEELKALDKLERLDLQNCKQLNDGSAGVLATFKKIKALDLKGSGIGEKAVAQLRAELPNTQILY